MALKLDYKNPQTVTLKDAYVRIRSASQTTDAINGNVPSTSTNVTVDVFANEQARHGSATPFATATYSFDGAQQLASEIIKQAYEHLKTLPEYQHSTNC